MQKPLIVRLLHWSVAVCFLIALMTGYVAFDFDVSMRIWIRDALFTIHRLSGMACGLMLVFWIFLRASSFLRPTGLGIHIPIALFHAVFLGISLIIPVLPWIARSLNGRVHELYTLLPVANLVSHPTNPMTYKLLQLHKSLIDVWLILIVCHLSAVLFHVCVLKDGSLKSMGFSRREPKSVSGRH